MNITFYTTVITENNIRDRDVTNGTTLNCTYRIGIKGTQELGISMLSASIPTYNYCYIPDIGKYYFLDAPVKGNASNEWVYVAREDPLFTLWNSFKNTEALVSRQENDFNPMLVDNYIGGENDTTTLIKTLVNGQSFNTNINIALINSGGAQGQT